VNRNWKAFWKGVGSVFDIAGSGYGKDERSYKPEDTIERALAKDWEAVARDMNRFHNAK
jgi:hypothetical protein